MSVRTAGGRAQRRGLRIHRTPTLRPGEVTHHDAITVTTPARTFLDLASSLPRRALERALDQAELLELFDLRALHAAIEANRGRRGEGILAETLQEHTAGTTLTRSELEERMLAPRRQHGIPRPKVKNRAAGLEVDFAFPAERVVVEADSYEFHRTRKAFERDRERDAILARHGYRTLRFTDRQIKHEPATVAAALRAALRSSA